MNFDKCISETEEMIGELSYQDDCVIANPHKKKIEALQYCLELLKSLKEMSGVVPSEEEIRELIAPNHLLRNVDVTVQAIRSQLLLGLAGARERLVKRIKEMPTLNLINQELVIQAILTELKGK